MQGWTQLPWEHSQNKGPRMRPKPNPALHLGQMFPHPWALAYTKATGMFG